MNNWPLQRDCAAFYGNPDPNGDGVPDRAWEDANLVWIKPRWKMVLAWDTAREVKRICIHKSCAPSLERVLAAIARDYAGQAQIERYRLHIFGGAYHFRLMRGSTRLSMHAYGCAIDLDPENNPLGRRWRRGMLPRDVVEAFAREGWTWGGTWKRPDAQHFQAARVA